MALRLLDTLRPQQLADEQLEARVTGEAPPAPAFACVGFWTLISSEEEQTPAFVEPLPALTRRSMG